VIFVTVGAQMAFDRLVDTVDAWAEQRGRSDVFAQVGPTKRPPRHIEWTRFLEPPEFRRRVSEAQAVVAHAGMGSILTALELGKPIVVLPRRGDLRETRNDHQVATALRLVEQRRVRAAYNTSELVGLLDSIATIPAANAIGSQASERLLEAVRRVVLARGRR